MFQAYQMDTPLSAKRALSIREMLSIETLEII